MVVELRIGDSRKLIKELPDKSIDCVMTSPPYWGLRDYGNEHIIFDDIPECNHSWDGEKHIFKMSGGTGKTDVGNYSDDRLHFERETNFCSKCGAWRGQLGLEPTPELFIKHLLDFFDDVKAKLKDEGNCFVNLGDTYGGGSGGYWKHDGELGASKAYIKTIGAGMPKCLLMIPQRFAWGMIERGWILRNEIIWCLSGGTYVYAKTQKGVMPTMIRDIARLKPETVQLWNGTKWTTVLGISRTHRNGTEIELVLRSGERISCTPTHKFPTTRGLLEGKDLKVGDVLEKVQLPDTENPLDCAIDEDAAWFAGLYIAEGSQSGNGCIQISGHSKETERWERLQRITKKFGGSIQRTINGNNMNIRMYGKILDAILNELVSGKIARDKCFAPVVWNYSNSFISEMLNGYLSGDGHWDTKNNRWRLGFTRNYNLERDIRTACSRLGYKLVLKMSSVRYKGQLRPTFKGEIRINPSNHKNNSVITEILEIRKARCRELYDIGVSDEPHVFALASGVLTHNSKPNHMPESVTDRLTKAHEVIWHFVKQGKYYYNLDAIREPIKDVSVQRAKYKDGHRKTSTESTDFKISSMAQKRNGWIDFMGLHGRKIDERGKNPGDVWNITTQPYPESHFAVFPLELVRKPILAGCPPQGTVLDPFGGSGTVGEFCRHNDRNAILFELNPAYKPLIEDRAMLKIKELGAWV